MSTRPTPQSIQAHDLAFLASLAAQPSLSAAAREGGLSKAAVSKRLALVEARAGVALINRSTRRMSLTPEGELVIDAARRILADLDELDQMLVSTQQSPKGLLRVNATLGFGRRHVAPLISLFARRHPAVDLQLQLSVNPPPISEDAFDVCIRFGAPPDSRLIAKRLASNRRLLCAAPSYLKQYGAPQAPQDLQRHRCIGIRQGDEAFGTWRLSSGRGDRRRTETVKTRGALTTNDGEIAVSWALDGHGIVMRAAWDVQHHLDSGRLVEVLPRWATPEADIYAVYPQRLQWSTRVRSFVGFVAEAFADKA